MNSRVTAAICIAFAMLAARPVLAQSADALKKAQASFDQAQTDYLQGHYDEAAKEFQEAYAARPFPQFLYNVGASFHMKGKKASDVEAYSKAVEFYKKYLSEEPQASDKPKVEKAIGVLEAEIKRIKDTGATAGSAAGSGSGSGAAPSQDVQQLGDVKVRGLVVVESEPQNATIYLDDKKKGAFAQTPWSGSLEGEHKIIIEKRGYKVSESTISADPSKLFVLRAVMSEESYLGWVEITSNVPGAEIFIDDKSVGAVGKTPMSQNIKPGKHTFWISAEGYDEYQETVDIAAGETHTVKGQLKGSPVGRLNVVGMGIEDSTILVDGKVLCERGPCIKSVGEGDHEVIVSRPGYKPYRKHIVIAAKTETAIKIMQQPTPGRGDAIWAYAFSAIFLGGGIYAGLEAKNIKSDLDRDIAAGMPPVDSNDPRFLKGKIYAIAADASLGLAAITLLTGVWYTLRDKGPPTTGLIDVRAMALRPEIGSHYAGLGMEVHW